MVFRQAVDKSEIFPTLGDICGWVKLELAEVSEEKTEVCNMVYYPTIFLSQGMTDPDLDKLNKYWENMTWEVSINGQLLDLEAFGTIDALGGRWWNVLLENPISDPLQMVTMVTVHEEPIERYGLVFDIMVGAAEGEGLIRQEVPSLLTASNVKAGQHAYHSEKADLDYLLFVPVHYWANPEQQLPVILYLHDAYFGNDVNNFRRNGLSKKLEDESNFPFLVVSTLAVGKNEFWRTNETIVAVDALLEEIEANLNVDTQRIYLMGTSSGDNGTWSVGLRYPDLFAALVPVARYYDYPFTVPDNICDLDDVPVWAFQGTINETLPLDAEQQIVEALEKCGGNVEFTVP